VSPFDRKNLGPWLTDPGRMLMYDGILVTKIDRLTRKRDWDIRRWAEDHDKKILVVFPELMWPPPPGDIITPIQWDLLVGRAAGEWTNKSQRYKRMLKAKRDQGYFTGSRPYPYEIVKVEGGKKLVPHPVRAAITRDMAKEYISGTSYQRIADSLTERQIELPREGGRSRKTPGRWTAQTVKGILTSPSVIGRIQVEGRTVHRAEPIISVEEYNLIQKISKEKSRRRAVPFETAMLTSILTCRRGHAMYRMKAHPTKALPEGRLYYYCTACPKGDRQFIWCQKIDDAVDEAVLSMTDMEHVETIVKPGDTYGEEIRLIKKEIAAADPEDEGWQAHVDGLRAEIERLRNLPRKEAEVIHSASGESVAVVWDRLTPAEKRQWLLARRGSEWLPGQERAKVQALGRDPETGLLILDIDIGEFTESLIALRNLQASKEQTP
jgi:DNA invertase Pin-like site-specific DNA recombinase